MAREVNITLEELYLFVMGLEIKEMRILFNFIRYVIKGYQGLTRQYENTENNLSMRINFLRSFA